MAIDLRTDSWAIKDQGRRGTCVACAATSAHEMVRAEAIELSIEFLHWASKQRDGLPLAEGTTLPAAKEALGEDGQPAETTWPYDDTRDQWAADYRPLSAAKVEATQRRLNGGEVLLPEAATIRDALDRGRPVVIAVRLHKTWTRPGADARIAMPEDGSSDLGGHAVVVVGYGDNEFIVQNSWGSDWGNDGFAYLPDDYLDRFAVAAWFLAL